MKDTLRILCLEDNEDDYELITYTLRKSQLSIVSKRVETKEEYMNALNTFNADVILSDHSLPQFNSLDALNLKKLSGVNIPFILVSGAVSAEFAVSCLKLGADDYLLKDNLKNLPSVVMGALEAKAREARSLKLKQELERKNQELLKVNKDLDSFLYSVSHDLRSPLNSMQGLLNLLKSETDPAAVKLYHEMMERSIKKLDQNLTEVLDYARNSKQELVIEKLDLEKLVREQFEKLKFMEGAAEVNMQVRVTGSGSFYSDKFRISNVLHNLISNSIKYQDTRKPNRFIRINVVVGMQEATVTVEDNGMGIPRESLDKVFNMFFRATDSKSGIGLGLHIVKEAVQMLKGEIKINSVEGEGTSFVATLPNLYPQMQVAS